VDALITVNSTDGLALLDGLVVFALMCVGVLFHTRFPGTTTIRRSRLYPAYITLYLTALLVSTIGFCLLFVNVVAFRGNGIAPLPHV